MWGWAQSQKTNLKTFLPLVAMAASDPKPFCFQLTWKSMWKVVSLTLFYLTVHHIMASINSYFHLELMERRAKERTLATPKSSAADVKSPALSIYHHKYRYEVISTNSSLSYAPLTCQRGKILAYYITDSPLLQLSHFYSFIHLLYPFYI